MPGERIFPPEKIAELDSAERQSRQPARPLVDLLAGYRPRQVLEVGVGTGYIAIPLALQFPDTVVVGIDLESQMLEIFNERAASLGLSNVRIASTVPGRIPFLDESVDAVLMVNLYHELDDRTATLIEARRVLNPGGRLIICDWDPQCTVDAGPPPETCVPVNVTKRELNASGFEGIAQYFLYEDFWAVAARRR